MKNNFYCLPGFSKRLVFGLFTVVLLIAGCSDTSVQWPESAAETRPWTRWWWPGNAVDRENISRELKEMAEAGIGG
jgi:hypothetical protein